MDLSLDDCVAMVMCIGLDAFDLETVSSLYLHFSKEEELNDDNSIAQSSTNSFSYHGHQFLGTDKIRVKRNELVRDEVIILLRPFLYIKKIAEEQRFKKACMCLNDKISLIGRLIF